MFNNSVKKGILALLLLLVIFIAYGGYGLYVRSESYRFNTVKNSGDYFELLRYMDENRSSKYLGETHNIALTLLDMAQPGMELFDKMYKRGRTVVDQDIDLLTNITPSLSYYKIPSVSGETENNPDWWSWEGFILYLFIRHQSSLKELDDSGRNEGLIKESLDYLIRKLDTENIPFIEHFHFVVNMVKESGVKLDDKTLKRLNDLLVAYIQNQDAMPRDKDIDNRWYNLIYIVMEEYPNRANIVPLLSANELKRIKYIHSSTTMNASEKIKSLSKEYDNLLKIDSSLNWTPLHYALLEYDDRIGLLERATEEYKEVKTSLEKAEEALSKVSGVTVDILGKLDGNLYEGLIAGQLRIVLMVSEELTQTGNYHFYITLISSTSGYINKFTNMPMPLYSQYMDDYEALRKERNVQLEKKNNMKERVKFAEENLKELDPILIDLFERMVNNKLE